MRTAAIFCISWILQLFLQPVCMAQNDEPRMSFRFTGMSLRSCLDSLMNWYPVSIVYLDTDVEVPVVSAACAPCGIEEALNTLLSKTSLMWIRMGNQFLLKQRPVRQTRPTAVLSGTVTDSLTGVGIPDALIMLYDSSDQTHSTVRRWCPTNPFGYFCIRSLVGGTYTVVVRALGYRTAHTPVLVRENEALRSDVDMIPQEIALHEVTIEGERANSIPAEGFSRGLYIRATPADQNQYFLDGARIYNPSHYGGVLNTFNAEALNEVQESFGGVPPSYGGPIGGILDLSMREGTRRGISGSAGTGSLGTQLSIEGPIFEATSFLLSGRRGYPDVLVPFLKDQGTPSRLGSSEMTAKLSHRLSARHRFFLSMYWGRDAYNNSVSGLGRTLGNNFSWGNATVNAQWIGIAAPSLFLNASAVLTKYDFQLDHQMESREALFFGIPLGSSYGIEDLSLRAHADHYYDEDHTVRGGVELIRHTLTGNISAFSSQNTSMSFSGTPTWELSVYVQDQWKILPGVFAEIGARATTFTGEQGSFSTVDPRFGILYVSGDDTRWYASLSTISQFLHPYRHSGVFLFSPPIFWYTSGEQEKPTTAFQATLGIQKGMSDQAYVISAESYYRVTNNLHEFAASATPVPGRDIGDMVLLGSGRSYGLHLSLRKRSGNLTGTIRYTLSWATNTFAGLNSGQPYTPRFNRLHELQLSVSYSPIAEWVIGATCILASGHPSRLEPVSLPDEARVSLPSVDDLMDLNGSRMPGFQRLEFRILRQFLLGGLPCQISVRLLNAYGLLDPFAWELRPGSDVRFSWRVSLRELHLFPLFPAVWMSVHI